MSGDSVVDKLFEYKSPVLCLERKISKTQHSCISAVFGYVLEQVTGITIREKNWIIYATASHK